MSVDAYLEGLYIPFCLHELFPDFRGAFLLSYYINWSCSLYYFYAGEFGANVHISEILFNSSASLDNMLVAKVCFVAFRLCYEPKNLCILCNFSLNSYVSSRGI